MFKKLKVKIKKILRAWLEIEILEDTFINYTVTNDKNINVVKGNLNALESDTRLNIHHLHREIRHQNEAIQVFDNTLKSVIHIGTDVYENSNYDRSWAVVCIEGNINIVKFVDLDRKNAREVLDFLKHFEAGRHCIDTPHKQLFYDGLFKF